MTLEAVRCHKDGSRIHVSILGTPVVGRDGKALVYGIYRDITDRKAAEDALRYSEERYRSIFESTSDAVLVFDNEGHIVEANPQAGQMYGYRNGELIGVHASQIIHPEFFHGFANVKKSIRSDGRFGDDSVNVRKDGTAFDVEVRGTTFSFHGEPHLLFVVRDIQQRILAERTIERTRQRIERLHEAAHALEACANEETAYRLTVETAEDILSFNLCSVLIEENGWLVYRSVTQQYKAMAPVRLPIDAGGGIAAQTFLAKRTFMFDDLREIPEARPFHPGFISGISVPIGDVGVFQAVSTGVSGFSPHDVRMAELLVGHTAETVRRLRLESDLRAQAMHDPLTGVYNRRYFNLVLEREILGGEGNEQPLSFLMIDVDGFKEINDTLGHQVGDRVLRAVAEVLQRNVRPEDTVVRYGGDEFLIVLQESEGDAELARRRIDQAIAAWCAEEDEWLSGVSLSLAIGCAHMRPGEERTLESVLAQADRRMYKAKRRRGDA